MGQMPSSWHLHGAVFQHHHPRLEEAEDHLDHKCTVCGCRVKVMSGFIPRVRILTTPSMLYVAIGIMGATVMPHNLFLHSAIVQTRSYPRTSQGAPCNWWEAI